MQCFDFPLAYINCIQSYDLTIIYVIQSLYAAFIENASLSHKKGGSLSSLMFSLQFDVN